ncbi:MAG TPA: DUF3306 domain-containing protein [Alphaproteobacteria bacterium]
MSEDFLSRWSRCKDEARRSARGPAPQPDRAAEFAPDVPRRRADGAGAPDAEPALTPQELAALPKLDELTAASDITGFLRRGVPEALRNAALRKMWMLDPAIRDFVGPARDYAYDWNTPGGVPGNGALAPEYVATMVRRVFGESDVAGSGQPRTEPAENRAAAVPPTADDSETETEAPASKGGAAADA